MTDLSSLLLISDLDGTLVGHDWTIPKVNIYAINRFKSLGGRFSVATGRTITFSRKFFDMLPPIDMPVILANGAVIYDINTDKTLWSARLDQRAPEYLSEIYEHFSGLEINICAEGHDKIFLISESDEILHHADKTYLPYERIEKISDAPKDWNKVLVKCPLDELPLLGQFVLEQGFSGIDFVSSSSYFFEFLPMGANKGTALVQLCGMTGIDIGNVCAIGDYYNDVDMLKTAGLSACPRNAPSDVKQYSQVTVCECEDGAVAEFIDCIIAGLRA